MLQNPIQRISLFFIKRLVRRFNAPQAFINLFKVLISTTPPIVSAFGILPVARVLWNLRFFIRQGYENINNLHILNPLLNTYVVNNIIQPILPYYKECIKYPKIFTSLYYYYLIIISFSFFKPVIFKLFRWSLGLILTSIGVLWNDSIQGISFLKDASLYIVQLLESYSYIKIPRLINTNTINIPNIPNITKSF
jgi:hypothetical protein